MTRFALAGLASLALLASCTQQPTEPTATPTATATVTVTATPSLTAESTPSPTPTPTPTAEPVGKTCADYPALPSGDDDASAAIEAAASAALRTDMVGAQTLNDTDFPDMIDVIVRICVDQPISEPDVIERATAIAVHIKQQPVAERIAELVISSWHPDGEYLGQGEAVTTDYQLFTWDPATTLPSNWK